METKGWPDTAAEVVEVGEVVEVRSMEGPAMVGIQI